MKFIAFFLLMLLMVSILDAALIASQELRHSREVEDVVSNYILRVESIKDWLDEIVECDKLGICHLSNYIRSSEWTSAYSELFKDANKSSTIAWLLTPEVFLGIKSFVMNKSGELTLDDVVLIASLAARDSIIKNELLSLYKEISEQRISFRALSSRANKIVALLSSGVNATDRLLLKLVIQALIEIGIPISSSPTYTKEDVLVLANCVANLVSVVKDRGLRTAMVKLASSLQKASIEPPNEEIASEVDVVSAYFKLEPSRAPLLIMLLLNTMFPEGYELKRSKQLQVEKTIELLAVIYRVVSEGRLKNVDLQEAVELALTYLESKDVELDVEIVHEVFERIAATNKTASPKDVEQLIVEMLKKHVLEYGEYSPPSNIVADEVARGNSANALTIPEEGRATVYGKWEGVDEEDVSLVPDGKISLGFKNELVRESRALNEQQSDRELASTGSVFGSTKHRNVLSAVIKSLNKRLAVRTYSFRASVLEEEVTYRVSRIENSAVRRESVWSPLGIAIIAIGIVSVVFTLVFTRLRKMILLSVPGSTNVGKRSRLQSNGYGRVVELYWKSVEVLKKYVPRLDSETHREYLAKVRNMKSIARHTVKLFERITEMYEIARYSKRSVDKRALEECFYEMLSYEQKAG